MSTLVEFWETSKNNVFNLTDHHFSQLLFRTSRDYFRHKFSYLADRFTQPPKSTYSTCSNSQEEAPILIEQLPPPSHYLLKYAILG